MGFYDSKGYWRSDGDGFYDSKGNWVSPGDSFYDGRGYLRSPGDEFYDSKGNWVSPGGAFYDGRGYLQTSGVAIGTETDDGTQLVLTAGFILLIPVVFLWSMVLFVIEWITSHLFWVYGGYAIADVLLCRVLTKCKRHHGLSAAFSFIGNYMCILSFLYITLVYAVPYVMINGNSFRSFYEFTAALAVGAAGVAILQFFNYFHERAFLEFILGCLFFVVVILTLKDSVEDLYAVGYIAELYQVETSKLFQLLFGFVT